MADYPLFRRLHLLEQLIVFGVRADPVPDYRIVNERAHGSISDAHAYGIRWRIVINSFESQARVLGICRE